MTANLHSFKPKSIRIAVTNDDDQKANITLKSDLREHLFQTPQPKIPQVAMHPGAF